MKYRVIKVEDENNDNDILAIKLKSPIIRPIDVSDEGHLHYLIKYLQEFNNQLADEVDSDETDNDEIDSDDSNPVADNEADHATIDTDTITDIAYSDHEIDSDSLPNDINEESDSLTNNYAYGDQSDNKAAAYMNNLKGVF